MASRVAKPLTAAAAHHLTSLEPRWSGSLYLQMLSSPVRKCLATNKPLPTSLMFQLKPVLLPASPSASLPPKSKSKGPQERVVMLPDQILHPKHAPKKPGKGVWVCLDPRVYAQMQRRASYKMIHPEATLVGGMEELVWWQLGERVVQEVELLRGRFGGRKRLDLFARGEGGEDTSFAVRLPSPHQQKEGHVGAGEDASSRPKPTFVPRFNDGQQVDRFRSALQSLIPSEAQDASPADGAGRARMVDTVYRAKRSHLTAPLGIALYRLNMWLSSSTPASHSIASQRAKSNP